MFSMARPFSRRVFLRGGAGGALLLVAGGRLVGGCVESGWPRGVLVSDPALCGACGRCAITCSSLREGGPGAARARVGPDRLYQERQFADAAWAAATCHMCPELDRDGALAEPACVANCPTGAAQIAEPGHPVYGDTRVRHVDPELCIGCGTCVQHCPHDHPFLADGTSHKCDLCLDHFEAPPCVEACPSSALLLLSFWSERAPRPFPWEAE